MKPSGQVAILGVAEHVMLRQIRHASRAAPRGLATAAELLPPLSAFATLDPEALSAAAPHRVDNLLGGRWVGARAEVEVPDPLNGEIFMRVADARADDELDAFAASLAACPKSGLHNPLLSAKMLMSSDSSPKTVCIIQYYSDNSFSKSLMFFLEEL